MSDADTHTVDTVYGPAEIETYECDSCGNRVAYEDTVEFTIGDRNGRACEHCEENGPIEFPAREYVRTKLIEDDGDFLFPVLLWPFTSVLVISAGRGDQEFLRGIGVSAVGAWLWILITTVIMLVML